MRTTILFFTLLSNCCILAAQKFDYVWVVGDDNQLMDTTYGGSTIDFNFIPPKAVYHYREMNFRAANTSMCDTSGRLLFYSNGCAVAGADDMVLDNGSGLNPGELYDQFCLGPGGNYISGPQSLLTLPSPGNSRQYYLFHTGIENVPHPEWGVLPSATRFYYSKIDMSLNGGKGRVIEKNTAFFPDTVSFGEMTAVKHANGTDWWIVTPTRYDRNSYYTFLLTAEGIEPPVLQSFDFNPFTNFTQGQTCFTPDGRKYVRYHSDEGLFIFDFDRITGALSNMKYLDPPQIQYPYGGCGVSPNSRYLYLTNVLHLYQLDLEHPFDETSFQLIGTYDGFKADLPTTFGYCQPGPDCKLYICTGNDTRAYHIVHEPDKPGPACNPEQHGLLLPAKHGASMPFFPNYRLGPSGNPGLPCSPVTASPDPFTGVQTKRPFLFFPNPFTDKISCIPPGDFSQPIEIQISDITGRKIWETGPTRPGNRLDLQVRHFPPGLYYCSVFSRGKLLQTEKLVKATD